MIYKAISDAGCVRTDNEDMAYAAGRLVRDGFCQGRAAPGAAFAVADGMGGYEGGEVASEIVVRSFGAFIKSFVTADNNSAVEKIKRWATEANTLVLETAAVRPGLSEMGTTFVGLIADSEKLWLVNIGDSRCYRLRDGVLKLLTTDHSERERTGDPSVPSNLIYNFMGCDPSDFFSDVTLLRPIKGDVYILCSDGLSDLVGDETIEANACNLTELVQLAKDAGGNDNITVVTVEIQDEQTCPMKSE